MQSKKKAGSLIGSLPIAKMENPSKAIMSLHYTFLLAVVIGLAGIVGYTLNLQNFGWKMLFLVLLLALASFISGFFLGFLFGIPKRSDDKDSAYHLSNNLTDISDWLTKIIIGLGLVEIKAIPAALYSVGVFIQSSTKAEDSIKVFSVCCLIYFSIFGLYFGYNYMRLFLSIEYKGADDKLLIQKELSKKAEILDKEIKDPANINESTKLKLADYNLLLKKSKNEQEYTFDDWYYKGLNAYENNQYNNAITFLEKALALDDKSEKAADTYLYIGASYSRLNIPERSLEINRKMLNDFPNYNKTNLVYNNIGVSLMKQKKREEALVFLDKAIDKDPTSPFPYYNKACTYALLNQKDLMIENLRKAIKIDDKFRDRAINDQDFANFSEDKDFKSLMKGKDGEVR
jgi:tetratricopeptide (TPR) repeat protein